MPLAEVADDGALIPNGLAQTLVYVSDTSLIQTITCVYAGHTYVKTFTYTGTLLTHVSLWAAQP